jgi:hypothetical protein
MSALPIQELRESANDDGEFRIAARMWDAVLRIVVDDVGTLIRIRDGRIEEITPEPPGGTSTWAFSIAAPEAEWRRFLAPVPEPFYQDLWGASLYHGFRIEGDLEAFYPYYGAVRRMFELMRASG